MNLKSPVVRYAIKAQKAKFICKILDFNVTHPSTPLPNTCIQHFLMYSRRSGLVRLCPLVAR